MNVPADSGPLHIRNAMIVANDDGTTGNFVAARRQRHHRAAHAAPRGRRGLSAVRSSVNVLANRTLSLGDLADGVQPLRLDDIDAVPGSTVPVYFQSGDGQGALIQVPVLDGALEYLAPLAPSPEPSFSVTPLPATPSSTPTASPTPAS